MGHRPPKDTRVPTRPPGRYVLPRPEIEPILEPEWTGWSSSSVSSGTLELHGIWADIPIEKTRR